MNTMPVIFSIFGNLDRSLLQFDVKNAYLHGELTEDMYMYMDLPLGLLTDEGKVCSLKKTLYELKQSLRTWFDKFSRLIRECF